MTTQWNCLYSLELLEQLKFLIPPIPPVFPFLSSLFLPFCPPILFRIAFPKVTKEAEYLFRISVSRVWNLNSFCSIYEIHLEILRTPPKQGELGELGKSGDFQSYVISSNKTKLLLIIVRNCKSSRDW